ncbi:hypothetical protein L7F22_069380 [Adiantum nelumboides]|nr:hypothetical protein [Adiantum nelumboides]
MDIYDSQGAQHHKFDLFVANNKEENKFIHLGQDLAIASSIVDTHLEVACLDIEVSQSPVKAAGVMQINVVPSPPPPPCDAQRKSSLETEPRTLYEDQIAEAQDAAIDIIHTKEPDEALEIFTTPTVEVQPSAPREENEEDVKSVVEGISERHTPPCKLPSAPF